MTAAAGSFITVELSAELEGSLYRRLLAAAYRASRGGRIVLLLRGVSRDSVDRTLDPVVREAGVDLPGVVYMEEADPRRAADLVAEASLIVASTEELASELDRRGIDHLPARLGASALESRASHGENIHAA